MPSSIFSCLQTSGLDICKALQVGWYNQSVASEQRLPDFGKPASLAMLVGNSRQIWLPFLDWLAHDPRRLELLNPLEKYVETVFDQVLAKSDIPYQIRFSHRPEPHHVAFQQLAEVAGLAWRSPAHLSIHPQFGCWLALRAVVVFDLPGPPGEPPGIDPVCGRCHSLCTPKMNRVLHRFAPATGEKSTPATVGHRDVAVSWRDWLAIRDACPVGREYRYSDDQIRYHYIKDRGFLKSLVEAKKQGLKV